MVRVDMKRLLRETQVVEVKEVGVSLDDADECEREKAGVVRGQRDDTQRRRRNPVLFGLGSL